MYEAADHKFETFELVEGYFALEPRVSESLLAEGVHGLVLMGNGGTILQVSKMIYSCCFLSFGSAYVV